MIKNEQTPYCCKNRLPPGNLFLQQYGANEKRKQASHQMNASALVGAPAPVAVKTGLRKKENEWKCRPAKENHLDVVSRVFRTNCEPSRRLFNLKQTLEIGFFPNCHQFQRENLSKLNLLRPRFCPWIKGSQN